MGVWTNNGLILVATAEQSAGANAAFLYVGLSTGCGTLGAPVASGTPITALPLSANLPANLSAGQSLTVYDGTNSETVTVAGGGATAGVASIPINSWTPAHNYAASTTGVLPTPGGTDTALYNETQRVAVAAASAGATPGQSIVAGYFDGTQPTGIYVLVGYFGGATATATTGTGTLMGEDMVYWNHIVSSDTNMFQATAQI